MDGAVCFAHGAVRTQPRPKCAFVNNSFEQTSGDDPCAPQLAPSSAQAAPSPAATSSSETPEKPTLCRRDAGLSLVSGALEIHGDFTRMLARTKPANLHRELLVRAAKLKRPPSENPPVALDATAGLGEDSFLLAAAGFEVFLYERNPLIAALLRDALDRAAADPALASIACRMHFEEADSTFALESNAHEPSVVVLDPMFPEHRKSSSAKKKLKLIQQLEDPCDDEERLLDAALRTQAKKIIIKRPPKGPFLAQVKPSYSLSGKAVRYDVIVRA